MRCRFEWDGKKASANWLKHGIAFGEAATVFGDPRSLTVPDPGHSVVEERFVTVGRSLTKKIVVVVYTERAENIRIISARPASRKERKTYEEAD